MNHWQWMNEHMQWMSGGHWVFMALWWLIIVGGIFGLGFLVGRSSASNKPPRD